MKLKTMIIAAGALAFFGFGIYLAMTEGVEPSIGPCTKYSLFCRR